MSPNLLAEDVWKTVAEDMLILAYVPEADQMSREDALVLATERDLDATMAFYESVVEGTQLHLETAVAIVQPSMVC